MATATFQRLLRLVRPMLRFDRRPPDAFFVQRFEGLPVVPRTEFLVDLARGRRVLHFGFLDHPLTAEKLRSGALLHAHLGRVAAALHGLDVDPAAIELYRRESGDTANGVLDIETDLPVDPALAGRFDLVLFPEILEHLRNPGRALERLRDLALANGGAEVCVTAPNALATKGAAFALDGVELVHPDHYAYYSPHTLRHLLESSGFEVERLVLCSNSARDARSDLGLGQDSVAALCRPRP